MKRKLCEPRPGWKQKIEEQGLVFSTTTMDDGRKIEYWNESAYYEFTMDEVEALELPEITRDILARLNSALELRDGLRPGAPLPFQYHRANSWIVETI